MMLALIAALIANVLNAFRHPSDSHVPATLAAGLPQGGLGGRDRAQRAVTVAASLVAGLPGPVAILLYAVVLSLPVWAACWWVRRY